ncbi:hypothetical protein D3C84_959090 [compost metagenome]
MTAVRLGAERQLQRPDQVVLIEGHPEPAYPVGQIRFYTLPIFQPQLFWQWWQEAHRGATGHAVLQQGDQRRFDASGAIDLNDLH